ncbi:hypothetical protein Tco_1282131 [Tanacetum coccineum]
MRCSIQWESSMWQGDEEDIRRRGWGVLSNREVGFRRISLIGFRSCASRSQTGASQSRQSTDSLKKPVVNITNTSTNKAFQVLVNPSCLQSPFNSRNELFAPCHVLFSPEARIHTRIEPFDLEFLDSVI